MRVAYCPTCGTWHPPVNPANVTRVVATMPLSSQLLDDAEPTIDEVLAHARAHPFACLHYYVRWRDGLLHRGRPILECIGCGRSVSGVPL